MSDMDTFIVDIEHTIHDYCYSRELEYDWDGDELVLSNNDEKGKEHSEEIIKLAYDYNVKNFKYFIRDLKYSTNLTDGNKLLENEILF